MQKLILEYTDVFYNKRYILEIEVRVHQYYFGDIDDVIDVTAEDYRDVT